MSPVRHNKPRTVHRMLYDLRSRRSHLERENPLVPPPPLRLLVHGRTAAKIHTHIPPSRGGITLASAQFSGVSNSTICNKSMYDHHQQIRMDVGQAVHDGIPPVYSTFFLAM